MKIEQQIYTSCPYGEGFDQISGFQVKARSAGLTDSMSRAVLAYANHYQAPRELRSREYNYYKDGGDLPADFLHQFPEAVTYHHVENGYYGLTRVRYTGKDYSGRTGNFCAHTLVFEPAALQPFDYNPLALARSPLFDQPLPEGTMLDTLPGFDAAPGCIPGPEWMTRACGGTYADSYKILLPALVRRLCVERTVILCFPDHIHAGEFIEILLLMLPPYLRCRTTFATYEPNPYTVIKKHDGGGIPNNLHIITTIEPGQGGTFEFRPHELNRFFVFDFVENKFSHQDSTSDNDKEGNNAGGVPYCNAVMDRCAHADAGGLKRDHQFLEDIGGADKPATWDALILAESLDKDPGSVQSQQLTPIVLSAVLEAAAAPDAVQRALELVWPLLLRTVPAENIDLFKTIFNAFDQLVDRLPEDAPFKAGKREKLLELLENGITSGHIDDVLPQVAPRAEDREPMLADAVKQLADKNWPQLNPGVSSADYTNTLGAVCKLAEQPHMFEPMADILWDRLKGMVETFLPDNRYERTLHRFYPLAERLPRDSKIAKQIPKEAVQTAQSLIQRFLPERALGMLKLTRQEEKKPLTAIFRQLLSDGWPGDFAAKPKPANGRREAWKDVLIRMTGVILENGAFGGNRNKYIGTVFGFAHWYGIAGDVWEKNREKLIETVVGEDSGKNSGKDDDELLPVFKTILPEYGLRDDVFTLLVRQTQTRPPSALPGWRRKARELTGAALRSQAPAQKTGEIIKLLEDVAESPDKVMLLADMFHEAAGSAYVQDAIYDKYAGVLKAAEDTWELRTVLADHGNYNGSDGSDGSDGNNGNNGNNEKKLECRDILARDFTGHLSPWPKNGDQLMEEWNTRVFTPYPTFIPFTARYLSNVLQNRRPGPGDFDLSYRFLELFGEKCNGQCLPLTAAFITHAPFHTVVEKWNPRFQRDGVIDPSNPGARERVLFIAHIKKIEAQAADTPPDAGAALNILQDWRKRRLKLDNEAANWGTVKLLELLGPVDMSQSRGTAKVTGTCLKRFKEKDLDAAVKYVLRETNGDTVTQLLQCLDIGQAGCKTVSAPEGKHAAEIVTALLSRLAPGYVEIYWRLLEERSAKDEPYGAESFREFKRLAKPSSGLARMGKQLIGRLFSRKDRGNRETGKEKTGKKNTNKKNTNKEKTKKEKTKKDKDKKEKATNG